MVTSSILKHLLSDKGSLASYINGNAPSFEDVKRRLFLLEREDNRSLPDHYYRLNLEKSFEGIDSLGQLIRLGLYRLADEHLELRDNRIHVKIVMQNKWQELITYIPPLVLQMAFLHIKKPLTDYNSTELIKYFREYILPNTKYTALPQPYIPQLKDYIEDKNGLHDLHMHLNGSTETDIAWQDFLSNPTQIYTSLQSVNGNSLVKEQFEQETYLHSALDFKKLLNSATSSRMYLYMTLFKIKPYKKEWSDFDSIDKVLFFLLNSCDDGNCDNNPFIATSTSNPFSRLIYGSESDKYALAIEGFMYILILNHIADEKRCSTASIFHFYLLILGLSNRLLVQQIHQFGFDQFQKITVNELRDYSEKSYERRFLQLHGNDQQNIHFLEGRFSPKDNQIANINLIEKIYKGWDKLKSNIERELNISEQDAPELKLIAHFIKKKDNNKSSDIRHKKLRNEIWQKASVLGHMKRQKLVCINHVVGVDAASSEFDAPPEVFAPAFRYLKRNGYKHFTFHAGEDFFHIISGLRAIFEAVIFNDFSCGDRIGHAVASGICPKQWVENVGETIFIKQGDYLDDLLFTYHLILHNDIEELKHVIPLLTNKIHELSFIIYKNYYSLKLLEDAWLMRRFCPIHLFSDSRDDATDNMVYDDYEWREITNQVTDLKNDERINILRMYHSPAIRKEYDKIVKIKTEELYSTSDLELLQLSVLALLHKKEIVIETLPTSNVRIGHHFSFDTYHLWNWLKWEKEGKLIPPIVVGTDDSGIFATNIYNEFANIYCNLITFNQISHNEAMKVIEKLDKNGRVYRFQ